MEEVNKNIECAVGECEPVRNGPYTLVQEPENPQKTRKTQMKCIKCSREWYEYF
jgi:hypothetical protein